MRFNPLDCETGRIYRKSLKRHILINHNYSQALQKESVLNRFLKCNYRQDVKYFPLWQDVAQIRFSSNFSVESCCNLSRQFPILSVSDTENLELLFLNKRGVTTKSNDECQWNEMSLNSRERQTDFSLTRQSL